MASSDGNGERKRRRRWGEAAASAPAPAETTTTADPPVIDVKAKALALQASVKARLAALKAKTAAAAAIPPPPSDAAAAIPPRPVVSLKRPAPDPLPMDTGVKRAKVYELDMSVTAPTFKQPVKKVNPYLAHRKVETEEEAAAAAVAASTEINDERLVRSSKPRTRNKEMHFIEPGTFVEIAERKRLKAANAEQSGFVSGRKTGQYVTSSNMAQIYGAGGAVNDDDLDDVMPPPVFGNDKTTFPHVLEWWDVELLPSKLKKQVAAYEGKTLSKEAQHQMLQLGDNSKTTNNNGINDDILSSLIVNPKIQDLQQRCFEQAALAHSKTAALVQHIVPVKPANAQEGPEALPTLYLTKRELKRQRKLRRTDKQRELQDMQAAGLAAPPEPRLTLRNFIRVLGDQAFLDPSQMEQKVMEQIHARQRAHMERNEASKLSKEARAEKLAKKLTEDTTGGVHVALFHVKNMSHPYHRTKVDLNAQQFNITGGVLECENPQLACVICEGGPKAIKKYIRLMTVRMKWKGLEDDEEEERDADDGDEDAPTTHKFEPNNRCELVWTGMAVKRFFKGFVFQACETSDQARKVLRAKGVGHFWDQVLTHASGRGEKFRLKLAEESDDQDQNDGNDNDDNDDEEEVIVMKDTF